MPKKRAKLLVLSKKYKIRAFESPESNTNKVLNRPKRTPQYICVFYQNFLYFGLK
jgi:hypothetical protein